MGGIKWAVPTFHGHFNHIHRFQTGSLKCYSEYKWCTSWPILGWMLGLTGRPGFITCSSTTNGRYLATLGDQTSTGSISKVRTIPRFKTLVHFPSSTYILANTTSLFSKASLTERMLNLQHEEICSLVPEGTCTCGHIPPVAWKRKTLDTAQHKTLAKEPSTRKWKHIKVY